MHDSLFNPRFTYLSPVHFDELDPLQMLHTSRFAAHVERKKQGILARAVDLASLEGLEGLTIGRLAVDLGMSKSGLFAHFGSKEDLQLAAIEAARERFVEEVFRPALKEPRGYPRLVARSPPLPGYVQRGVFPGGCFFAAASFEFDGRPGPLRDAVAAAMTTWMDSFQT